MKGYGATGKRILVVDDEPIICEVFLKVLGREGYEVEIAENGREGENKLKEKDYDLIIVDMRTPVMDGRQLYRRIGEIHPEMIERIIITSGDTMCDDIQGFLDKTGAKFLPKPFTSGELKEAVEKAFNKVEDNV